MSVQVMSRLSKEIFRKTSLTSVVLPYYSNPLSVSKLMMGLCKGSRSIWIDRNSQWSHLLTNLRTKISISCNQSANKHVNYLAKISPYVELDFTIDFETPEDIRFIKNLSSQIKNKSLSKFKVLMNYSCNSDNNWESEEAITLVLSIVSLIQENCEKYEINIVGKKIQIIELPDCITLANNAIFGENQWIVDNNSARFAKLLGEFPQTWKELGVGDFDSKIINEFKSPDDINNFMSSVKDEFYFSVDIFEFYFDYYLQRHDYSKVFKLVYSDWLYIFKPYCDSKDKCNEIYPLIKPVLRNMKGLKSIRFSYFEEIYETIAKLDLHGLQQNGVEINFASGNLPQSCKYVFTITADECIILHTDREIEALNLKMKGDIEIEVYTCDFTYIVNSEYLLCTCYNLHRFVIDCEYIENKQKICFPKFTDNLKASYKRDLVLVPLSKIKQLSYMAYFSSKDEVFTDIQDLANEFDCMICKPLIQPSSLFCLLSEKTKIDIYIPNEINECDNDLLNEFQEEEFKSYISVSPNIKSIEIDLFEITSENVSLFIQLLKGCIRLNELIFIVRESNKKISEDIIDTIVNYNQCLSQIDVSINTEGTEFYNLAQISCDRNIIVRIIDD